MFRSSQISKGPASVCILKLLLRALGRAIDSVSKYLMVSSPLLVKLNKSFADLPEPKLFLWLLRDCLGEVI